MKIATWNVERLKHKDALDRIVLLCSQLDADILVLTENDQQIVLDYTHCIHTPIPKSCVLPGGRGVLHYRPTEHRVSIFSKYPCVRHYKTFDPYTALCVELKTEKENLVVYGTVIGILGNRDKSFLHDLQKQISDFDRLAKEGKNLCVCGDFNCSFGDNYYFTQVGRSLLQESFQKNQMRLLTKNVPYCVDHIAISSRFVSKEHIQIQEWNHNKSLSDHKGVAVSFV